MWFTENPWPPLLLLLGVAVVLGSIWWERRQARWLVLTASSCALAVVVWWVERSIVTDCERVEQSLFEFADTFQRRDAKALDFISQQAPVLRGLATAGLKRVELGEMRITDVNIEEASPARIRSHLRVNARVSLVDSGDLGHRPTRWILTWQQEAGEWLILDAEQLDPLTGEIIQQAADYLVPRRGPTL